MKADDIDVWLLWHGFAALKSDSVLRGSEPYVDWKSTEEWRDYDGLFRGSTEWQDHLNTLKNFESNLDALRVV